MEDNLMQYHLLGSFKQRSVCLFPLFKVKCLYLWFWEAYVGSEPRKETELELSLDKQSNGGMTFAITLGNTGEIHSPKS